MTRAPSVFAEECSDLRGQIVNLRQGEVFPAAGAFPSQQAFVLTGLSGTIDVQLAGRVLRLIRLSQLVVLPGVTFQVAIADASFQLISVRGASPR